MFNGVCFGKPVSGAQTRASGRAALAQGRARFEGARAKIKDIAILVVAAATGGTMASSGIRHIPIDMAIRPKLPKVYCGKGHPQTKVPRSSS